MPHYFKILNALPSFTDTFELASGATMSNPYPNYGSYGDHLEDYFHNHMRETPSGGSENLVAFLTTQAGITNTVADGLTMMGNHLFTSFGVTFDTVGYGLLDFRGSTSWNILTGDGLIGPSNTDSTAFTDTRDAAVAILNHFTSVTPNVKWAFAGLPTLPHYTVYAPNAGEAPANWGAGATNSGVAATNYWSADHPTIGTLGESFYMWYSTPEDLRTFYEAKSIDSVSVILDASDWWCPDINPVEEEKGASRSWYSIYQHSAHTNKLMEVCGTYRDELLLTSPGDPAKEIYPLVNSMYRSRGAGYYDDPTGVFETKTVTGILDSTSTPDDAVVVVSGYTGSTGRAADVDVNEAMFKGGMVETAARNLCEGFVYLDQTPLLVALACTGTETDATAFDAQKRARNFLVRELYPGGYMPPGVWAGKLNETKNRLSYAISSNQLRYFSESVPVGSTDWPSVYDPNGSTGDGSSVGATGYSSLWWQNDETQTYDPAGYSTLLNGANQCCTPTTEFCCRTNGVACGGCEPVPIGTCDGVVVTDCQMCEDTYNPTGTCYYNGVCVDGATKCACDAVGGQFYPDFVTCQTAHPIDEVCPSSCNFWDCFEQVGAYVCASVSCGDGTYSPGHECVIIGAKTTPTSGCCEGACLGTYNCSQTCDRAESLRQCSNTVTRVVSDGLCDTSVPEPCSASQTFTCCPGLDSNSCPQGCDSNPSNPGTVDVPLGLMLLSGDRRSLKDLLLDPDTSDETKVSIVETMTGLAGYKAISDLDRLAYTFDPFAIGIRRVSKLANNINYFADLPINNSYLNSELNFRENFPASDATKEMIVKFCGVDGFFVHNTYIP